MGNVPKGAMSSPYGGNYNMGGFTVSNTDYIKEPIPFTEEEFELLKTKLESVGAVLRAKNDKLILFELGDMILQVGKN